MKLDNSSYTVTPPDLMLTEHGVSVLISSTNDDLISKMEGKFDIKIYRNVCLYTIRYFDENSIKKIFFEASL